MASSRACAPTSSESLGRVSSALPTTMYSDLIRWPWRVVLVPPLEATLKSKTGSCFLPAMSSASLVRLTEKEVPTKMKPSASSSHSWVLAHW